MSSAWMLSNSQALINEPALDRIAQGRPARADHFNDYIRPSEHLDVGIAAPDEFCSVNLVVSIATSGRPDLLHRTLTSLGECKLPPGYSETIVVENGIRAGAEEVVKASRPELKVRYIHSQWANKSAAMNAALKTVDDCLMFFTDDDVRFDPRILCHYSMIAGALGKRYYYGGPINVDYDAPPPRWLRQYLPYSAQGWKLNESEGCIGSTKFLGSNWAAFSENLRAAGGFNIDRGPGSHSGSTGDETEMQERLLSRGLKGVYLPKAYIWHYVPSNRCSPDWAIQRIHCHGIEEGARAVRECSKPRMMPPWRISIRYLKGILRAGMWTLSMRPELRFKAKHRRSYDRGLMKGVRLQYKAAKMPVINISGLVKSLKPLLPA
jgi:GT2 family glycosyltransferase